MRPKIRLTFPRTHTSEEIDYLFEAYALRFPGRLEEWVKIERTFSDQEKELLRKIQTEGINFLSEICEFDSDFALSSAWFDLRMRVVELANSSIQ